MTTERNIIKINYPSPTLAIVHANVSKNIIFGLAENHALIQINTLTQAINEIAHLKLDKIDFSKSLSIRLSANDTMISIVNTIGQFGYIYDLKAEEVILNLDRKDYQIENSSFPIQFLHVNEQDYLVHASDWNHLDIYDFKAKKNITYRETNKYEAPGYLDYFYSELHVSPSNKWILSSGWVWHPVSVLKFIDLNRWMNTSVDEPEQHNEADFSIMSYYWDRALCWIDDNTLAYLYDPREEDLDEEERAEQNFEEDTSYVLIYDVSTFEITKKIQFSAYEKDSYFEAASDCRIFHNGDLIISSKKGVYILDKESGEIIFKDLNMIFDQYNERQNVFYRLIENQAVELIKTGN
jgi:hypothetical protein